MPLAPHCFESAKCRAGWWLRQSAGGAIELQSRFIKTNQCSDDDIQVKCYSVKQGCFYLKVPELGFTGNDNWSPRHRHSDKASASLVVNNRCLGTTVSGPCTTPTWLVICILIKSQMPLLLGFCIWSVFLSKPTKISWLRYRLNHQ